MDTYKKSPSVRLTDFNTFLVSLVCLLCIFGQPNGLSLLLTFYNVILIFVLGIAFFYSFRFFNFYISSNLFYFLLFIFLIILWSFFSLIYSPDPLFGLRILSSALFKIFLFIIFIVFINSHYVFNQVIKVISIAGVFFAISGLILTVLVVSKTIEPSMLIGSESVTKDLDYSQNLYYYNGLGFVKAASSVIDLVLPRLQSFFMEPGYFAFFMESSVFLSLILLENTKNKKWRILIVVGIVLQILSFLLSLSAAGAFCLIVGYFFYIKYSKNITFFNALIRFFKPILTYGLIIGIILFLIEKDLIMALFKALFLDHFSVDKGRSSADDRADAFSMGLKAFTDHPILGIGFNQMRIVSNGLGTNNSFLTIAAELGMVGLVLYLSLLWFLRKVVLELSIRVKNLDEGTRKTFGALTATIVAQTLHTAFIDVNWSFHYWISLGLVCAYLQIIQKDSLRDKALSITL